DAGGDVQLGDGTQNVPIGVGSRHGVTQISGQHVRLRAADTGSDLFSQIGYFGPHNTPPFSTTGSISVTAQFSVTAQGGDAEYAYAHLGNGGLNADGNHSGNHSVEALDGDIFFTAGDSSWAYAQVGNGGHNAIGDHSGNHSVEALDG
ncbi:MAG: hypothetical protein WDZ49_13220, partial [Litorilinea sp.]